MPIARQDSASSAQVLATMKAAQEENVFLCRHQSINKMGFRNVSKRKQHLFWFCRHFSSLFFELASLLAAAPCLPTRNNNIGTCPTTCLITCTQPVDASHPVGGSPSHRDICGPFHPISFAGRVNPQKNTNTSGYPTHSRPNPPHIAASELPPVILISLLPGNSTPLPHPTVTINKQPCRSPTSSSRTSSPTPACSGSGPSMTSPASSVPTAPASPTSWTPSPSSWACSPATSVRSR